MCQTKGETDLYECQSRAYFMGLSLHNRGHALNIQLFLDIKTNKYWFADVMPTNHSYSW